MIVSNDILYFLSAEKPNEGSRHRILSSALDRQSIAFKPVRARAGSLAVHRYTKSWRCLNGSMLASWGYILDNLTRIRQRTCSISLRSRHRDFQPHESVCLQTWVHVFVPKGERATKL